ncbi:MAG: zinc ribbon domain-containing protein [Chloroflexota bacterium]
MPSSLCPNCGANSAEGNVFCGKCGKKLAIICPNCSFANPMENSFCHSCGQKLNESSGMLPKKFSLEYASAFDQVGFSRSLDKKTTELLDSISESINPINPSKEIVIAFLTIGDSHDFVKLFIGDTVLSHQIFESGQCGSMIITDQRVLVCDFYKETVWEFGYEDLSSATISTEKGTLEPIFHLVFDNEKVDIQRTKYWVPNTNNASFQNMVIQGSKKFHASNSLFLNFFEAIVHEVN